MAFFIGFYVRCPHCNHRCRPHKSPREGIKLAILGQKIVCSTCRTEFVPPVPDRPLARRIRIEFKGQGQPS